MANISINTKNNLTYSEATREKYFSLLKKSEDDFKNFQASLNTLLVHYKNVLDSNVQLTIENERLRDKVSFLEKFHEDSVDDEVVDTHETCQDIDNKFLNENEEDGNKLDSHSVVLESETEENLDSPILCRRKIKRNIGTTTADKKPLLAENFGDEDSDSTHFSRDQVLNEEMDDKFKKCNKNTLYQQRNILPYYDQLPCKPKKVTLFDKKIKCHKKTKIEKKLLPGWSCKDCESWYDGFELGDEEKKK